MHLRRTDLADAAAVGELLDAGSELLFGHEQQTPVGDPLQLLEQATLAISGLAAATGEDDGEGALPVLVAQAVFSDLPPPVPAGADAAAAPADWWAEHFARHYDLPTATPFTSLFLNLLATDAAVAPPDAAATLLRTAFVAAPDTRFFFCVFPAVAGDVLAARGLDKLFAPVPLKADAPAPPSPDFVLHVCRASDVRPSLVVRPARTEDYDDLVPIFNQQSESLTQRFGEFFLAELIESQTATDKALVAESPSGRAVGFMALHSNPNLEPLSACFDLSPWNGLQTEFTRTEPVTPPKKPAAAAPPAAAVASPTASRKSSLANPVTRSRAASKNALSPSSSRVSFARKSSTTMGADAAAAAAAAAAEAAPPATRTVREWRNSAFCISLFCFDEEYEMQALEMMDEAFDLFPEHSYCILTLPRTVAEMPLLRHFTRAAPHPSTVLRDELYIFHRFGLLETVSVRRATKADTKALSALLSNTSQGDLILGDIAAALDAPGPSSSSSDSTSTSAEPPAAGLAAFVTLVANQIVGAALLSPATTAALPMRAHYNIEEYIIYHQHRSSAHANLHHFVLNPVFDRHSKFVLREAMRQAGVSCLYHRLYQPGEALADATPYTLVSCLDDLLPVRRRRQPVYPAEALHGNIPSERIRNHLASPNKPYALTFLTRKLMLEPKITVNASIVVVGASDTGLAFLEALIYMPHLCFTNLTLVSPHGIHAPLTADPAREAFLPTSHAYSTDERKQVAWDVWVNIVRGKVTSIDRASKTVATSAGDAVAYDYLVLTPGLQSTPRGIPGLTADAPAVFSNVIALNEPADIDAALSHLPHSHPSSSTTTTSSARIAVFGSSLKALTAVQALLALGVPAVQILLIHDTLFTALANPELEAAVAAALEATAVTVLDRSTITAITESAEAPGCISHIEVGPAEGAGADSPAASTHAVQLLLLATPPAPDAETFHAVNDSCLVFDGRLVVDNRFQTNDPAIYAAGPFTKYSRKYYAGDMRPEFHNSVEIGQQLAGAMLPLFDPLAREEEEAAAAAVPGGKTELHGPLPVLLEPKVVGAVLPGGAELLHVQTPAPPTPWKALQQTPAVGRELVTGAAAASPPNFFRIRLDLHSRVDALTILAPSECLADRTNFLALHGLHDMFLNNMRSRFDEGLVKDFFAFFRQPWAVAIFQDRFRWLVDEILETVERRGGADVVDMGRKVGDIARLVEQLHTDRSRIAESGADPAVEDIMAQEATLKDIGRIRADVVALLDAEHAGIAPLIKDKLLDYLNYNSYHLPMYARAASW